MRKAKIVLVRPLYEENAGLVARAMANFGFGELALVEPECNWLSGKAMSRAMHGKSVLLKARVFDSIAAAAKDCSCVIATSAKARRNRKALGLGEFVRVFSWSRGKVALVFGPEPSGLSAAEIDECDFVVSIGASKAYPTLNLSHAVCVVLYSLFGAAGKWDGKGRKKGFVEAKAVTKKRLLKSFENDLEKLRGIDDRATVLACFKALVGRALVSEKEALALIAFLSEAGKSLCKGKGRKG